MSGSLDRKIISKNIYGRCNKTDFVSNFVAQLRILMDSQVSSKPLQAVVFIENLYKITEKLCGLPLIIMLFICLHVIMNY